MLLKELPGDNRAIGNVTDHHFKICMRTEHTDRPAFIVNKKSYSFFDIYQRACRVTSLLGNLGIEGGDEIALVAKDGRNFPVIFISALTASVVPMPMITFLKPANYLYCVNDSRRKTALPIGLRYQGGHYECG
jgi:acyl-CoA synthetase (AMP-forming)/AMP-acid ligase II